MNTRTPEMVEVRQLLIAAGMVERNDSGVPAKSTVFCFPKETGHGGQITFWENGFAIYSAPGTTFTFVKGDAYHRDCTDNLQFAQEFLKQVKHEAV